MWLLVYTLSAKLNMVHIKCGLSDNTSALQTKTKKGGGGKSGSL